MAQLARILEFFLKAFVFSFADISVRTFVKKEDTDPRKLSTTPSTFVTESDVIDDLHVVRQQQSMSSEVSAAPTVLGLPIFTVVLLAAGAAMLVGVLLLGVLCVRRVRGAGDKGRRYPRLLNGHQSEVENRQNALRTAALARDFEHIPMMSAAAHDDAESNGCSTGTTSTPRVDTGNRVKVRPQMVLFENPLAPDTPAMNTLQRHAHAQTNGGGGGHTASIGRSGPRVLNHVLPPMNKECAELGSPVYLYGELPPPPPFLLQPSSAAMGAGDMASAHSILDSYHSGETVDDLDEFDNGDVTYFEKYPYFANV